MTSKIKSGLMGTVAALLLGCTNLSAQDATGLTATEASSRLGTAIWLETDCPSVRRLESGALLAPLIALGAEFAVNLVGNVMEARKEGLTGQFIARGTAQEEIVDGNCIVIARARFGDAYTGSESGGIKPEHLDRLGISDYPAFYAELEVNRRDDEDKERAALTFDPIFVAFGETAAKNEGSGKKEVALVISVSKTSITDDELEGEEGSLAVFRHMLGRLEVGSYYESSTLQGTESSHEIGISDLSGSINITALVTESEEPGVVLKVFSEAFTNKKGDIQTGLENALKEVFGVDGEEDGS